MNANSSTCTNQEVVLLDDGEFAVAMHCDRAAEGRGVLQRRCYEGVTTPDGYECVGTFAPEGAGRWVASIDSTYDPRSGAASRRLGKFASSIDAIAALWAARHQAHCRHQNG